MNPASRAQVALAFLLLLALAAPVRLVGAGESGPIADNSFLIEEAYNQESRVVQHIVTWMRRGSDAWDLTFTQEWPLGGARHQVSYTIPVRTNAFMQAGLGDIGLHYRFQALGVGGGPVAIAPRLTVYLATGELQKDNGAGAPGLQVNLPISTVLSPRWVAHTNAGATWIRSRESGVFLTGSGPGTMRPRRGLNLGQSLIWLLGPRVNLMMELAWDRLELESHSGVTEREERLLLSPGLRWAHNFSNGLQIVPGLAVPIGLGPSRREGYLFAYLSGEHGF